MTDLTSPGIYPDVPDATYHSWDRASSSKLKKLVAEYTPAHIKQDTEGQAEEETTEALNFGHALHLALLQPHLVDTAIGPAPINPKTGKPYGRDTQAWEKETAGDSRVLLGPDEADKLSAMLEAVYAKRRARELLEMAGPREVTLLWDEPVLVDTLGEPEKIMMPSKARPDIWGCDLGMMVDFKTTRDARRRVFNNDAIGLGYYIQGAWYLRAAERISQAGNDIIPRVPDQFMMILIEKTPPYLVAVRNLFAQPEMMIAANRDLEYPLQQMARAYQTGQWPGYSDEIEDVELPGWKMREVAYE